MLPSPTHKAPWFSYHSRLCLTAGSQCSAGVSAGGTSLERHQAGCPAAPLTPHHQSSMARLAGDSAQHGAASGAWTHPCFVHLSAAGGDPPLVLLPRAPTGQIGFHFPAGTTTTVLSSLTLPPAPEETEAGRTRAGPRSGGSGSPLSSGPAQPRRVPAGRCVSLFSLTRS